MRLTFLPNASIKISILFVGLNAIYSIILIDMILIHSMKADISQNPAIAEDIAHFVTDALCIGLCT
jgi:hypothetical protein